MATASALIAAVAEHAPDLVLTDLAMPDLDGVAATRQLLEAWPELPIIALTMHEDDEHVFAALRAGARGYLVKGADGEEIVRAVHAVAGGGAVYGGSVARRIVAFYAGDRDHHSDGAGLPGPHSTRAGRARAARTRLSQPRDLPAAVDVREDSAKPRVPDPDQTAGARPHRGGAQSPRIRDRLNQGRGNTRSRVP